MESTPSAKISFFENAGAGFCFSQTLHLQQPIQKRCNEKSPNVKSPSEKKPTVEKVLKVLKNRA